MTHRNITISTYLLTLVILLTIGHLHGQNAEHNHAICQCSAHIANCDNEAPPVRQYERSRTNSLGYIQPNTNPVLPASYNFMEYVYAEPDDQGVCDGSTNATAVIDEIFLSQTHRHAIGHPFLFTIGERPALLQIAVTGNGPSPDVQVEGILNGVSQGVLCLDGPATLSDIIDLDVPNMDDYFSVTLPKSWVEIGLELTITTSNETRVLTQSDLKIRPYTELNLVNVDMDIMDYNHLPHRTPIFDGFLEELASAVPVSVVRFGQFPDVVHIPVMAANDWEGFPSVVSLDSELDETTLDRGLINAAAQSALSKIQLATGDFPNTIYFGNTLNLDPGGWGNEGHFVGYEYTDVFIHELGHAFSLPHWEWEYELDSPAADQHLYPYSGETGYGGGRGEAWNFIQNSYEFVSPYCQDESGVQGEERSDCMQREHPCVEVRPSGPGPWDGYGDFTVKAINNFLLGSDVETGQVEYRGSMVDYQFKDNPGYPRVVLENGQRVFTRVPSQPQNTFVEDFIKLPGMEKINQEVFVITGSAHATDISFNIIYNPIQYNGTLLPTIDPTNETMFAALQGLEFEDAPGMYDQERDITLKLTYIDGTISHVLVPLQSPDRINNDEPNEPVSLAYFSVVVPGDQPLCNVELYLREFLISDPDNPTPGNINDPAQNITADNFMDDAVLMATLDYACNCPGTPGYIEPGTPCDDGNPYTAYDEEDGFCNCIGTVIPTCGQINNSAFTQSLAGWRYWGIQADGSTDEAAITVLNINDAGFGFEPIEVLVGETYTIKFEAYAAENRSLTLLNKGEYDYENDQEGIEFLNATFDLTTTKTEYEATFTATESDENTLLEFNLSGSKVALFLDNVCFDMSCGSQEIPYNGIDDDCDPLTLDDDLDQDGFLLVDDCDDENADINPNETEIPYNGIDEDCNAGTFDDDLDQDGFLLADDCDDENAGINPDAEEILDNGIDEDCDGEDQLSATYEIASTTINIYPNPTTDMINIDVDADLKYQTQIYSLEGKLQLSALNANRLNMSSMPSGIYIFELTDLESGQKIIEKIIKDN